MCQARGENPVYSAHLTSNSLTRGHSSYSFPLTDEETGPREVRDLPKFGLTNSFS